MNSDPLFKKLIKVRGKTFLPAFGLRRWPVELADSNPDSKHAECEGVLNSTLVSFVLTLYATSGQLQKLQRLVFRDLSSTILFISLTILDLCVPYRVHLVLSRNAAYFPRFWGVERKPLTRVYNCAKNETNRTRQFGAVACQSFGKKITFVENPSLCYLATVLAWTIVLAMSADHVLKLMLEEVQVNISRTGEDRALWSLHAVRYRWNRMQSILQDPVNR